MSLDPRSRAHHLRLLGLTEAPNADDVKAARKDRLAVTHPDNFAHKGESQRAAAEDLSTQINTAADELLKDLEERVAAQEPVVKMTPQDFVAAWREAQVDAVIERYRSMDLAERVSVAVRYGGHPRISKVIRDTAAEELAALSRR